MGRIGLPEIILLFSVFILLFGAKSLPEIGKSLGKTIKEFRKAGREFGNETEDLTHAGHENSG